MPNKALFLDRDGVINVESGFLWKPEKVIFTDGIFDFCRSAKQQGHLLIVVTNQSGIGRGLYSEKDFFLLMCWMMERFKKEQCQLDDYYYCPHHPDKGCQCRKPLPGMILQAAKKWNVDLSQSLLIGDQPRDIEAGQAAGVKKNILFDGKFPPF